MRSALPVLAVCGGGGGGDGGKLESSDRKSGDNLPPQVARCAFVATKAQRAVRTKSRLFNFFSAFSLRHGGFLVARCAFVETKAQRVGRDRGSAVRAHSECDAEIATIAKIAK